MTLRFVFLALSFSLLTLFQSCTSGDTSDEQSSEKFEVIAYYTGDDKMIENYRVDQLSQIIYSFLHLEGNKLAVDNSSDSMTIRRLVSLKKQYPKLKVLLSLGGWGGCETCSDVFNTSVGRKEFAESVKDLLIMYDADGIDMDWEYPGIEGFPGHTWRPEGKQNFTLLIEEMRKTLGPDYEISFAAGGFTDFLKNSIEWDKVMPLIQRVNIMSYDLVNGYATITGHHTPLYSNSNQILSLDYAVNYLDSIGVPRSKMIAGAAFYSRIWENVPPDNNGLYQSGIFKEAINFRDFNNYLSDGFIEYWDSTSNAPYRYNAQDSLFATFDNPRSATLKTNYIMEQGLGGIMFWELTCDDHKNGLLEAISTALNSTQ